MSKLHLLIVFGALLAIVGCGGAAFPVSTVEGSVSVDGEPIPAGTVSFTPLSSHTGQAIAAEIRAGKYRSDKVPRGRSLVHITAFQDKGDKHVEFGITYPKLTNLVPEKYRSGIELSVDAPKLTHNFELATK